MFSRLFRGTLVGIRTRDLPLRRQEKSNIMRYEFTRFVSKMLDS